MMSLRYDTAFIYFVHNDNSRMISHDERNANMDNKKGEYNLVSTQIVTYLPSN